MTPVLFQALRYCGTAAMILAELSGNLAGRLFSKENNNPKKSFFVYESQGGGNISIDNLGWPLVNIVVFGVILSENFDDDVKLMSSKDFQREFMVTFVCTIVLELFYFKELSLLGLLLCGLLLYFAVRELDPVYTSYIELGIESSESFSMSIMKPIQHILSERKSRKIALFLLINTAYMVVEFAAGFMSNSLGLISDACHMLFDCAALAIGLYASYISRLPANSQFNYGRGRFEILSGYTNAVFLVLVGALIVLESFERILDPQEISTNSLLTVSIGGLVVNVVDSCSGHEHHHGSRHHSNNYHAEDHKKHEFRVHHGHDHNHAPHDCAHHHDHHGYGHQHDHAHDHHDCAHHHDHNDHHHDLGVHHGKLPLQNQLLSEGKLPQKHQHGHIDHNMEGIFLHVLADTMGSVGVVMSTLLIKYKGWLVADPACSIFISVLIISSVIPLLRNSSEILLQRVPRAQELVLKKAISDITNMKGVCRVQNLHVWSFTNTDIVGTVHLHISAETDKAAMKSQVSHILHDAGIKDLTLQVECVEL
ncbi:hypothetical protein GOBAR_DD24561 [Gossypium barbadense]|nr:hypothetical protein GOBAR_DD24561 [Gossypium barbadense]